MHRCSTFAGSSQQQLHRAVLAGMRQGNKYLRAASFHPDLSRQHQSPVACHAEWAGQQVGGQVEGQQVGGQEKNGQQYQLSSPIVWFVHKHYSTQGSRAITQPSTKD